MASEVLALSAVVLVVAGAREKEERDSGFEIYIEYLYLLLHCCMPRVHAVAMFGQDFDATTKNPA